MTRKQLQKQVDVARTHGSASLGDCTLIYRGANEWALYLEPSDLLLNGDCIDTCYGDPVEGFSYLVGA